MSATLRGRTHWSREADKEGHRDYFATYLVNTSLATDGPYVVSQCAGLPGVGTGWSGDTWAKCLPLDTVRYVRRPDWGPGFHWLVQLQWSSRPIDRCMSAYPGDPISEPAKVGGSFSKFTREAVRDRNGDLIVSLSHELYRGSKVERDDNRPTIWVEVNVPYLPLVLYAPYVDAVNDQPLWGLPKYTIKLSNINWTRRLRGDWTGCTYFYKCRYEFEVNYKTWDRTIAEEGTRVLPANLVGQQVGGKDAILDPRNFVETRANDEELRGTPVFLSEDGDAAKDVDDIALKTIEFYDRQNLLALGIPAWL